ncbi:hypothetical protein ACTFIZ_003513 [Dictyostelium cf. discoideum]
MTENDKFRFKEPNFSFTDYYKDFINLYPEEFDQVSKDIRDLRSGEKKFQVEASCYGLKMEYEECKKKLSFFHTYFCYEEANKFYECIKVNNNKFERYLKYYIHSNKQSYMEYWENQEKEYLEKLQKETSKK